MGVSQVSALNAKMLYWAGKLNKGEALKAWFQLGCKQDADSGEWECVRVYFKLKITPLYGYRSFYIQEHAQPDDFLRLIQKLWGCM